MDDDARRVPAEVRQVLRPLPPFPTVILGGLALLMGGAGLGWVAASDPNQPVLGEDGRIAMNPWATLAMFALIGGVVIVLIGLYQCLSAVHAHLALARLRVAEEYPEAVPVPRVRPGDTTPAGPGGETSEPGGPEDS